MRSYTTHTYTYTLKVIVFYILKQHKMSKPPNINAYCPHGVKMVMCGLCNGGQICIHSQLRILCLGCLEIDKYKQSKK